MITGIDIKGELFLKSMPLIMSPKVHFARQRDPIAHLPQSVRPSYSIFSQGYTIIPDANVVYILAGHKGHSCRHAHRAICIGMFECHAFLS